MIYIVELINYLKFTEYKFNLKLFFVSTTFFLIFILFKKTDIFYCDAYIYWELSKSFHSSLSISNYPLNIRGYLLPFIFSIFSLAQNKLNSNVFFYFFQASLVSIIFLYIVPNFLKYIFNKLKINLLFILSTYLIFLIFWWRYLLFPLSDIPGLLCFYLSIIFVRKSSAYLFLSGIFLYSAINIRPSFLICLPIFIFYIIYIKNVSIKNMLFLILGFIILSIPELIINISQKKSYSIFPNSNFGFGGSSLGIWQLKVGIFILRYETFVNNLIRTCNGVYQKNPFVKQPNYVFISSISDYFIYIFTNYKVFIISVFSHCVSMVTPLSNSPYILEPLDLKIFPYLSSIVWSISLSGFWKLRSLVKKISLEKIICLILLISPSILGLFIGIETRFSISLYIIIYLLFVYLMQEGYKWYKDIVFYIILITIIFSHILIMNENFATCI